jgi:biotin carboxyl carrier protein
MNVIAELAANVWQVHVAVGDVVSEGDVLLILESMKMEIPVEAPCSGVVSAVNVAPEGLVQEGDILAVITSA